VQGSARLNSISHFSPAHGEKKLHRVPPLAAQSVKGPLRNVLWVMPSSFNHRAQTRARPPVNFANASDRILSKALTVNRKTSAPMRIAVQKPDSHVSPTAINQPRLSRENPHKNK